MKGIPLILLAVLLGATGQVIMKMGMKIYGEVSATSVWGQPPQSPSATPQPQTPGSVLSGSSGHRSSVSELELESVSLSFSESTDTLSEECAKSSLLDSHDSQTNRLEKQTTHIANLNTLINAPFFLQIPLTIIVK